MTRSVDSRAVLEDNSGAEAWWEQLPLPGASIQLDAPEAILVQHYRFGDGILELAASSQRIIDVFQQLFAECALSSSEVVGTVRLRCVVRCALDSMVTLVRFESSPPPDGPPPPNPLSRGGRGLPDGVRIALSLLENHYAKHTHDTSSVPGWHVIRSVAHPARPFMAICGADTVIDRHQEPPEFLINYVVGALLSLQKEVLFVHAASVGIRGCGSLLIGRTQKGKSTVSLALASRGHAFLGDDVAAVRVQSRELMPFRRAASIRPGPRASGLDELVAQHAYDSERLFDGTRRQWVQVRQILPQAAGHTVPFRCAFFFRGFADTPAVTPFTPTLQDMEWLILLSYEHTVGASWGFTPGRRMMKFLVLLEILKHVRCYFLDVGPPDETARLIEETTEDLWDTQ